MAGRCNADPDEPEISLTAPPELGSLDFKGAESPEVRRAVGSSEDAVAGDLRA